MKYSFVFIFLLLANLFRPCLMLAQETGLIWYEYSKAYQSYIPVSKPGKKASFFLALKNARTTLRLEAPEGSSLFMDNRLLSGEITAQRLDLSLDSLAQVFAQDSAFFTVYHPVSLKGLKTTLIKEDSDAESAVKALPRSGTGSRDFFLFALVLMLLSGGIIRKATTAQIAYILGFRQLYQYQIVDGPLYSYSFFSQESTTYYLFVSFLYGLFGLYFMTDLNLLSFLPSRTVFLQYLLHWLFYSVLVYFVFYMRFVIYKLLSGIYNFRRYTLVQNYDFLRVALIISIMYLLIMTIDLFIVELSVMWLLICGSILLTVYIFTTFRKLNKLYSHTKLHLFSYLCMSEIVPWIFLLGNLRN